MLILILIEWVSSIFILPCSLRSCCGECSVNTVLSLWLPLRCISWKWPGTGSSDPYALLHQESAISLFRFPSLFVTNNLALEKCLNEQIRSSTIAPRNWSWHSFNSYPSKALKRILGPPTWIKTPLKYIAGHLVVIIQWSALKCEQSEAYNSARNGRCLCNFKNLQGRLFAHQLLSIEYKKLTVIV